MFVFRKFGVLCFLVTSVLRFALLPYYYHLMLWEVLSIRVYNLLSIFILLFNKSIRLTKYCLLKVKDDHVKLLLKCYDRKVALQCNFRRKNDFRIL